MMKKQHKMQDITLRLSCHFDENRFLPVKNRVFCKDNRTNLQLLHNFLHFTFLEFVIAFCGKIVYNKENRKKENNYASH